MAGSRKYPAELRERAVRMVAEVRDQYASEWAAFESVASKLGIGTPQTLLAWVRRDQVDSGKPPRSDQRRGRGAENRELKRANDILKSASTFFAAELDRRNR